VTSRSLKNSGTAALMVKYMSSFRFAFSKENLEPRRKVVTRWSSAHHREKCVTFYFIPLYRIMWTARKRVLQCTLDYPVWWRGRGCADNWEARIIHTLYFTH
jgi:hypothetical protein